MPRRELVHARRADHTKAAAAVVLVAPADVARGDAAGAERVRVCARGRIRHRLPGTKGLHSSTSQLNLSHSDTETHHAQALSPHTTPLKPPNEP